MLVPRVAHRFAKSLLEIAIETSIEDKVYEDAILIHDACRDIRELNAMFLSPVIRSDQKQKIFDQVFTDKLTDLSQRFFMLIIRKNREELTMDIASAYIKQYKDFKKIHTVHVETAIPLSDDNRKRVMEYLKTRTTENIELVEKVNESLVGGIILRLRDVQIDASVKNGLLKLEREFSKDMYSLKYKTEVKKLQ